METSKSEFRPQLLRKKQKVNWGPIFVLLVLVLITGPIIAPVFSTPFRMTNAPTAFASLRPTDPITSNASVTGWAKNAQSPPNNRSQFGIEETPLAASGIVQAAGPRPNFSLSGLVYSPKDSYCLINGKIVKTGEQVDGARLVSVTPDKVILDYRGDQIILPVSD